MTAVILAGAELHAAMVSSAADAAIPLCEWQFKRGILCARLSYSSLHGWSVMVNNGFNFLGVLKSARLAHIDGSFEAAKSAAEVWVAEKPDSRFALTEQHELDQELKFPRTMRSTC